MNADEQIRAHCLNDAIRACTVAGSAGPGQIVATAQLFLNFIIGKKEPSTTKKKARKKSR